MMCARSRGFKPIVAAIVLVMSWFAPMAAEPYSDRWQAAAEAMKRNEYAKAYELFRSMAEQGYSEAQFQQGFLYRSGWGVPRNYNEAFKWFQRAANQGHAYAQTNLGFMYRDGEGVQRDYVRAYMWFSLASSSSGSPFSAEYLDSFVKKMTPAQIAEAQKLAREWKPTTQSR
jgi:TPR repeat protein